jgi:hypothetical protein
MHLIVRNYRGVLSADIELAPITLIAGKNYQGKSSICQAAAAAASGATMPFLDPVKGTASIPKAEGKLLVAAGKKEGYATLANNEGMGGVKWPDCEYKTDGTPPKASRIAAGLINPCTVSTKLLLLELSRILHTEITREELAAALAEAGSALSASEIERVWGSVEQNGWDPTHAAIKERGSELRGKWEQVTGEAYGHVKGNTWTHPAYLTGEPLERLRDELARLRTQRDEMMVKAAISEEEQGRLENLAKIEEESGKYRAELLRKIELAKHQAAEKKAIAEASAVQDQAYPCPHCNALLEIYVTPAGPKVEKSKMNAAERAKQQQHWSAKKQEHEQANLVVKNLQEELAELDQETSHAKGAGERLAELVASSMRKGVSQEELDMAQEHIRGQEAAIQAFEATTTAQHLHQLMLKNMAIVKVLAPDGLRQQKMSAQIELFNKRVLAICEAAGWKAAVLDDSMQTYFGGRPYDVLSKSERYRLQASLQLAIASLDGSDLVVLDDADVLDSAGRNGLMDALLHAAVPYAIIGMQISTPRAAPDLQKAGIGQTWWIEGGALRQLSELVETVGT